MLALIGGDEFRPACDELDRLLLRRAGPAPRVAILPTAAAHERPKLAGENGRRHFERLGAAAEVVPILTRHDADDERLARALAGFSLIYLTGGNPWYLRDTLAGSPAQQALEEALDRGALVAGSSAGAMVLAEHLRGQRGGWEAGLGLVRGIAVLPHHERADAKQTLALVAQLPAGARALGIERCTGAVLAEGKWRVAGAGQVRLYSQQAEPEAFGGGSAVPL